MSKIESAASSVVAGVSQLPDHARKLGEHSEQVNMVSDPIRGLVRRKGSVQLSAVALAGTNDAVTFSDAVGFQSTRLQVEGAQYSVHYRSGTRPAGTNIPDLVVVNDATGQQLTISRQTPDANLDLLLSGGVRAAAALGRFVLFSGNTVPVAYSTTENFLVETNQQRHVAWVRGGAYSRSYKLSLIRGNQKFTVEFTTPSASYPEPLDTSDILATDPDYLKKVNDRTNAYNSAVTRWAGDALAVSSPESIASRLAAELQASGFLAPGGTVATVGSSVVVTDPSVEDIEVDDGGDQTLMLAAGNVVKSVETLTSISYPGKVVQVRAQDGADAVAFYMRAVAKDGSSGAFTEVSWEEAAGTSFVPTSGLCFGTVVGSTFHIASTPAGIRALTGLSFPDYQPSRAGDLDTNGPPEFLRNGRIDMLTVFQDRVMLGARNAVNTSVVGDYLNFFRPSVVTVSASDPVNFGIIGGEEDTLRRALMFDLNLVLFGDAQQYVINGRRPFVPGQVTASVMASIPGAGRVQPVMGENYMFFVKANGTSASLHRFRPGEVDGSPVVDELSDELDDYLRGAPVDVQVHSTPNFCVIRTNDAANTVYVYQFKDYLNGENQHRAWHKWTFSGTLGALVGVSSYNGFLRLVFRRSGHVIVDSVELDTAPNDLPYLDSLVPSSSGVRPPPANADSFQALGRSRDYVGARANIPLPEAVTFVDGRVTASAWFGVGFPSFIRPAYPVLRDQKGAPMLGGTTTVSRVLIRVRDTGGVAYNLTGPSRQPSAAAHRGRVSSLSTDGRDTLFPQVGLLLMGDDANATTFTDASLFNRVPTLGSGSTVQNTSAFSRFGRGSITATGTNAHLNWTLSPIGGVTTWNNWCVDLWARYRDDYVAGQRFGVHYQSNQNMYLGQSSTFRELAVVFSGFKFMSVLDLPLGEWFHIALSSQQISSSVTAVRVFINGVLRASTVSAGIQQLGSLGTFTLGRTDSAGFSGMAGYVDAYRVTLGAPRWTADFVPPSTIDEYLPVSI